MPKVVSNIQRLANRRNARNSTGPTTPEGRALTAALPAPEQVLKLVRYENMLDRQLHRALDLLERRQSPQRPLPTSMEEA